MTDATDLRRYSVETGIPVAPTKYRKAIYPFGTMNVGDSFPLNSTHYKEVDRVRSSMHTFQSTHVPMKFVLRSDGKVLRCWRVA